jgi:hypothetical protein
MSVNRRQFLENVARAAIRLPGPLLAARFTLRIHGIF